MTRVHKKKAAALIAASLGLVLAACGSDDSTTGTTQPAPVVTDAPTETEPPASTDAPVVTDAPVEGYTVPDLSGKSVVFASFGGAYQDAEREAHLTPFEEASHIDVQEVEGYGYSALLESIQAGSPLADVVDIETYFASAHCGTDLMELDFSIIDLSQVDPALQISKCGAAIIRYGTGIFYNTDVFGDAGPTGCKDFFDLEAFPGKRGVYGYGLPNQLVECALIADGVAPADLYPIDLDRAFAKIATIKDEIVLWGSGAESQDMMVAGEVVMLQAWDGRAYNAIETQGAPYRLVPADDFVQSDDLVVPMGAAHPEEAMHLIQFMMQAVNQANLTAIIPYTPTRLDAVIEVDDVLASYLPTNPAISTITVDQQWWTDNEDIALATWDEMFAA